MTEISRYLEKIIEPNNMESLYMRSSLNGLVGELKKYQSEENVMRFITDTDFLIRNYPLFDFCIKLFL